MKTNAEFEAWLRQPLTEEERRRALSLSLEEQIAVETWLIPLLQSEYTQQT